MNEQRIRYALFALLAALTVGCLVCALSKPEPSAGSVCFERRIEYDDEHVYLLFAYHPPQDLKSNYLLHYECVDALTGKEFPARGAVIYEALEHNYEALLPPTNAAWRVKVVALVESKGLSATIGRFGNMLRSRNVKAWKNQPFYALPPVYSSLITNPVSSKARHDEKNAFILPVLA